MTQPLLSILIPTVPERRKQFGNLVDEFRSQIGTNDLFGLVEIISDDTGKQMPVGQKRNILYQRAKGLFSLHYDDDDEIHPEGLKLIIDAIRNNPEVHCITFHEYCLMNGVEYKSRHSLEYGGWEGDGSKLLADGFHFHRTPFYKNAIKTEIAQKVPVPPLRFGEDHEHSKSLYPLLKTEFHVPVEIYRYIHNSSNFTERYGYDRD